MPTLKIILDNLDGVDDSLKSLYLEEDGKFVLDVDGVDEHPSVLALRSSLTAVRKDKETLRKQLKESTTKLESVPDDFDATEWTRLREEEDARKADPDYDKKRGGEEHLARQREQYEQRLRDQAKKHEDDLKNKDGEIAERDGRMERLIIDDGLTSFLTAVGVPNDARLKGARAMLRPIVKIEKDEKDELYAFVETDLGPQKLDKFIDTWAKSDEGKVFIPKPTGGGAEDPPRNRNIEANPWLKDSFNLTQQGAVIKEDRTKARRLMKVAGRPDAEINSVLGNAVAQQ
jgi:hypothetical protein